MLTNRSMINVVLNNFIFFPTPSKFFACGQNQRNGCQKHCRKLIFVVKGYKNVALLSVFHCFVNLCSHLPKYKVKCWINI